MTGINILNFIHFSSAAIAIKALTIGSDFNFVAFFKHRKLYWRWYQTRDTFYLRPHPLTTRVTNPLNARVTNPLNARVTNPLNGIVKGEPLHVCTLNGELVVSRPSSRHPANASAGEDLTSPNLYLNIETMLVYNGTKTTT